MGSMLLGGFKMKHKTFIGLFSIFLIAASLACVFAAESTFDSSKFNVPDDFSIESSNDTTIVLKYDDEQIIITEDIVGVDDVTSYLKEQGFTYQETVECNRTFTGTESGQFSYEYDIFTKNNGMAVANYLVKDNYEFTVIVIDNNFDGDDDDFEMSDLNEGADQIIKELMLA